MTARNGCLSARHAAACALRLSEEEHAYLARRLHTLTSREREVVRALCEGGPNEALADRLCVALPTLRTHLMRINQKLGSESKDDIVRFVAARLLDAYRRGELPMRDGRRAGAPVGSLLEGKAPPRAALQTAAIHDGRDNGEDRNHRYR